MTSLKLLLMTVCNLMSNYLVIKTELVNSLCNLENHLRVDGGSEAAVTANAAVD